MPCSTHKAIWHEIKSFHIVLKHINTKINFWGTVLFDFTVHAHVAVLLSHQVASLVVADPAARPWRAQECQRASSASNIATPARIPSLHVTEQCIRLHFGRSGGEQGVQDMVKHLDRPVGAVGGQG